MNFHMPDVREVLALLVVAFVGGFAWAAGKAAFDWVVSKARRKQ